MARHFTRCYRRVTRVKRVEIVGYHMCGHSQRKIAKMLKLKRTTVRGVIQKWNQSHSIDDKPKSGRPKLLDDHTERILCRMVTNNNVASANELIDVASRYHQVDISVSTAVRMLYRHGIQARRCIPKPMLTQQHKAERFEFALSHRHWTVDDWKAVVFSDETLITAQPIGHHKLIWTKRTGPLNPDLIIPTVQGGGAHIMTWGCISTNGFHDFINAQERLNAEGYIQILRDNLLPVREQYFRNKAFVFQQDGASIHTAHATQEFLQSQNIQELEWPAHSPDLNIIEHVWHYLKMELHKKEPASNANKLWDNVVSIMPYMWSDTMTEKINNLYESIPARLAAVIAKHGGHTKF